MLAKTTKNRRSLPHAWLKHESRFFRGTILGRKKPAVWLLVTRTETDSRYFRNGMDEKGICRGGRKNLVWWLARHEIGNTDKIIINELEVKGFKWLSDIDIRLCSPSKIRRKRQKRMKKVKTTVCKYMSLRNQLTCLGNWHGGTVKARDKI